MHCKLCLALVLESSGHAVHSPHPAHALACCRTLGRRQLPCQLCCAHSQAVPLHPSQHPPPINPLSPHASKCAVLPKQREQQERWQGEREANWVLATPPVPVVACGGPPHNLPRAHSYARSPMRRVGLVGVLAALLALVAQVRSQPRGPALPAWLQWPWQREQGPRRTLLACDSQEAFQV